MDTPLLRRRTPAHDAAARWRERCLFADVSLFTNEPVWTERALRDLRSRFTEHPLLGTDSFMTKFRQQLDAAPPPTIWLAAEMLYVMNLFPSARAIGGDAKRKMVREVWEWSGTPLPTNAAMMKVLDSGVGHPGTAYLTRRDRELEYLIDATLLLKTGTLAAREVLQDPWLLARVLEEANGGERRLLRHILLNLLFPDVFEGIISGEHRQQIIAAFDRYLADFQPSEGDSALVRADRQILHIRQRLESELGPFLDFYDEKIRPQWQAAQGPASANPSIRKAATKASRPPSSGSGSGEMGVSGPDEPADEEVIQQQGTTEPSTPAPVPSGATLARLLHDHIGSGLTLKDDQLKVADEVRALCSVLMASNARPPISVGLFGDWGTGKSFFMELMHGYVEDLAKASREAPPETPSVFCSHVVQIRFNAWHYMDSNLWASLATRVFEGLAEHVSQREDAEAAKKRLFEELATSEGILSQVRAERDTADAELAAAQSAKQSAQDDLAQATADRNEARGRREKAQEAQVDLQKEIDTLQADRKALEGTLGRSVSVVVAAALDEARGDPEVASAMDDAARTLGIDRERLQVEDVRQVLWQMRGVGGRLRALGMALGSPDQRAWRIGAIVFVLASVAAFVLAADWLSDTGEVIPLAAAAVASAGTLIAAVERWVGRLQRGIGAVERANELIQGRIDGKTAAFRAEEAEARTRLAALAERERAALAEERAARDEERRALEAERTAREIEQMARAEQRAAEAAEAQAQQRVDAVQNEIAELRAGRRLQSFIQERSGTAEYRQHLGLVSTIRKDFEKLSTLLTDVGTEGPENGLPHIERIVLYIDDLDRCPENRVVEVLQAVHLLLAFPLFIVVVGVDSRWLLRSLEDHYAALRGSTERNGGDRSSTPQNYLEKIFQIPFTLRRMESGGFGRLMEKGLTVRRPEKADDDGAARIADNVMINAIALQDVDEPGAIRTEPLERTGDDPGPDAEEHEEGTVPIDLAPRGLEIEEWEMKYLSAMHPLIGSPRSAKRFVNIYQFIRAGLGSDALERFRGTKAGGEYQVVAMLLAALIGHPRECQDVFDRLMDPEDASASWWMLVSDVCTPAEPAAGAADREGEDARARLSAAFQAVKPAFTLGDAARPFRDWAPAIKRFSFHFTP
jgi:predicted KAP-like P-loop ATPase